MVKFGVYGIVLLVIVGLWILWIATRHRNIELFQSGITLTNTTCTAIMPERTYNPAPIPANTAIPNIQIDITPYIQGNETFKIDLNTISNFYASGISKTAEQTERYNSSLVPIRTYANILNNLFKSKNIQCWKDHTRVCLYLMNCNSMIIPFMTKAVATKSMTDEAARRNNFKSLLSEPTYSFLNTTHPFGTFAYDNLNTYHIIMPFSGVIDKCIRISNQTVVKYSSVLAPINMQGWMEWSLAMNRIMVQLLTMRVNISETSESSWHTEIDDICLWLDKLSQYTATSWKNNNMIVIKFMSVAMGAILNCRNMSLVIPPIENFLDTNLKQKEGFIWTETNRDVASMDYHVYTLSDMFVLLTIFKEINAPFNFTGLKQYFKKTVENATANTILQNQMNKLGWSAGQFHTAMETMMTSMGISLSAGKVVGLTGSPAATSCSYTPPPAPCNIAYPPSTVSASCNCSIKKISLEMCLAAMTGTPASSTSVVYTPILMRKLIYYTNLMDTVKQNQCPTSYEMREISRPGLLDMYNYIFENGTPPTQFPLDEFPVSLTEFIAVLKKWNEVERIQ